MASPDGLEEERPLQIILAEMGVEIYKTVPSQIIAHERTQCTLTPEEATSICKAYERAIIEWMLAPTSQDFNQLLDKGAFKIVNSQNLGKQEVLNGARLVGVSHSPGEHTKIKADAGLDYMEVPRRPNPPFVVYYRHGDEEGKRCATELATALQRYRGYGRTDAEMVHVSRLLGYSEDNILDFLAKEHIQQAKKKLHLFRTSESIRGVEVYCDASVFSANPASETERPVARIAVIIPSADYGLVERLEADNAGGLVAVNLAEERAIRRAQEICHAKGIGEFTIFSDSSKAVAQMDDPLVRWCSREDRQLAGKLLARIVDRVRYLRKSEGSARMAETEAQREIAACFQSSHWEFRLSESPLWTELSAKVAAADARARSEVSV